MARIYEEFKVISVDEETGHILLEWWDANNPLNKLIRNHKIPLEAEAANWTEELYRSYFVNEIEDAANIPEWARLEARNEMIVRQKFDDIVAPLPTRER